MDALLPYFQVMPLAEYLYQDFLFPGIALLMVNGLTNLAAAVLLLQKKKSGVLLGGVFSKQETFCVDSSDYPNIGSESTRLVVFFSRMGYVKKQAYEIANKTGAQVYEIRAAERTQGTAGFWWCGRFAMHRWTMPIEPVTAPLTAYDHVTICTPIWVFSLASPVREFCRQSAGKIKAADYVLVHHTRGQYKAVAAEMDRLLGIVHTSCVNVRCRIGAFETCK